MAKKITVFTPTYNRVKLLNRLYNSLIYQTNNDFIWMIIDDGSTDETSDMVSHWIKEGIFQIEYYYKKNGGVHTAYNLAYQMITTELNVCIDSDDIMPNDGIEKILHIWENEHTHQYAGIIGLDANYSGSIIGTMFPNHIKYSTVVDLYKKFNMKGDKKIVYRSDITREVKPYPEFPNESFVPLGFKTLLIDMKYRMIVSNEVFCIVEYQPDGLGSNIKTQYYKSPKGMSEARKNTMKYSPFFCDRFKATIQYISISIISGERHYIRKSPRKILTVCAFPIGIFYIVYLNIKVKKSERSVNKANDFI